MEEIDLKDLLKMFWSKRMQIALIIAIFTLIGVIYITFMVKPVYTSYTTLALASSNNGTTNDQQITSSDIALNSKLVETYNVLIQSKNVIRQVKSNLAIDISEDEIRNNIKVSSEKNTEIIRIEVTNANNIYAKDIANETAKVFMEEVKKMYNIENVQVVDVAEISEKPSNIHTAKDVIIFMFIGIVASCMYVFVANMLDTTIKTAEEIESTYKIPVLVSIPLTGEIGNNKRNSKKTKKGKRGGRR